MKHNIHILHVIPAFGGGISSYVKNLVTAQNEDGLIMDVIGFGKFPISYVLEIEKAGGAVYELPSFYKNPIAFVKEYGSVLDKNSYDILHCHISGYKGFVFKVLAKCKRINLIAVHAHRTNDEKQGRLKWAAECISRFLTRIFADIYFTCSDMAADFIFGKRYCMEHIVYMMPNSIKAIDYEKQISENQINMLHAELGISEDCRIVGHIGRFNKQKNHIFMLDIIKEFVDEKENVIFLFIGDGQLFEYIKNEAENKKLDKFIRFLGKRKDVALLLQFIEVLMLPSFFEGLPTVAIEAQAAGTPIIMSNTITRQANMDMGLTAYLPISSSIEWKNEIVSMLNSTMKKYTYEYRMEKLKEKGFVDTVMRNKYNLIIREHMNLK